MEEELAELRNRWPVLTLRERERLDHLEGEKAAAEATAPDEAEAADEPLISVDDLSPLPPEDEVGPTVIAEEVEIEALIRKREASKKGRLAVMDRLRLEELEKRKAQREGYKAEAELNALIRKREASKKGKLSMWDQIRFDELQELADARKKQKEQEEATAQAAALQADETTEEIPLEAPDPPEDSVLEAEPEPLVPEPEPEPEEDPAIVEAEEKELEELKAKKTKRKKKFNPADQSRLDHLQARFNKRAEDNAARETEGEAAAPVVVADSEITAAAEAGLGPSPEEIAAEEKELEKLKTKKFKRPLDLARMAELEDRVVQRAGAAAAAAEAEAAAKEAEEAAMREAEAAEAKAIAEEEEELHKLKKKKKKNLPRIAELEARAAQRAEAEAAAKTAEEAARLEEEERLRLEEEAEFARLAKKLKKKGRLSVNDEDTSAAQPQNLALPSLQPSEQQAMITVISALTSQIQAFTTQNESLAADLANAKSTITKLETYHDALVFHAKEEAKRKATRQAQHDALVKKTTEYEQTIREMRAANEALEAELQAEQERREEKIAQGICDGLRALIVSDLEDSEAAEEKSTALPKGAVSKTFKELLSELAAANERAGKFEQRVVSLEEEMGAMGMETSKGKDRIRELEEQLAEERGKLEPLPDCLPAGACL